MRKILSVVFFCSLYLSLGPTSHAQKLSNPEIETFQQLEDSLIKLAKVMLRDPLHTERTESGFKFSEVLKHTLDLPHSFYYPFENLGNTIHVEVPTDKKFKIFNWLVAPSEVIRRYYAVIQTEQGLFPLLNNPGEINEQLKTKTLDRKTWYGNEIYKLQSFTEKNETYYLWYGINTDGVYSNKKSLDILYFRDGVPYFGLPLFEFPSGNANQTKFYHRLIWEYSKLTGFTLNYDEERKMILFDRLRSVVNDDKRRNTYAPSGQTEGLRWKNGRFEYVNEAIPILKLEDGGAPVDGVFPGR